MLLTGEQLFRLYCNIVTVGKGKNATSFANCTYPDIKSVDGILYEGYFGFFLTIVFLVVHLGFFHINCYVGRDFVKCFATATVIPLTAGVISRFFEILLTLILEPTYFIVEIFNHIHTICQTTAFVTALLGLVCFFFSHAFILCTGKAPDMDDSWAMYYTLQILGWIVSGSYHFTSTNYKKLPIFILVAVMWIGMGLLVVAGITSIISLTFCYRRKHTSDDPVVKFGVIRHIWGIFSVLWLIPCVIAFILYYGDASNIAATNGIDMNTAAISFYQHRLLEFFAGPFMLLVVLTLPTYRDALFTALARKNKDALWAHKTQVGQPLISGRQQIYPS